MPLHFIPGTETKLTWFTDSPDTGDPKCICSLCANVIPSTELPIRIFQHVGQKEIRLHIGCASQVIVELAPKSPAYYSSQPGYTQGREAFQNGVRRGANPYEVGTKARVAWWAGWDSAWAEENPGVSGG